MKVPSLLSGFVLPVSLTSELMSMGSLVSLQLFGLNVLLQEVTISVKRSAKLLKWALPNPSQPKSAPLVLNK